MAVDLILGEVEGFECGQRRESQLGKGVFRQVDVLEIRLIFDSTSGDSCRRTFEVGKRAGDCDCRTEDVAFSVERPRPAVGVDSVRLGVSVAPVDC